MNRELSLAPRSFSLTLHTVKYKNRRRRASNLKNPLGTSGYEFSEEIPLSDLERFKDHRRLKVFYYKGLECANPECDRVGTRLISGTDLGMNIHWDIYTEDLIMITVDHIIPRSKGGGEELENKNPMCSICNSKKGDKIQLKYITEKEAS